MNFVAQLRLPDQYDDNCLSVEEQLTYKVGDKSRLQCLHLWCVKQFVVIQLSVGETEHARQFLQNVGHRDAIIL